MKTSTQPNVIEFIERDIRRKEKQRPVWGLALTIGVLSFPVLLGLGLRDSLSGAFEPRVFIPNLSATIILGLVTAILFRRLFSSRTALKWIWPFLILSLVLATERIFFPAGPPTTYSSSTEFWHENMRCLVKGISSAGVTGIWISVFAFFFFPWPSRRYRAVMAILAGLSGSIMLGFHCDSSSIGHVLISHIGQGVVLAMGLFILLEIFFRAKLKAVFPELFAKLKDPGKIG